MSYEIVKSISIQDNKVFFTSASNNIYPRTFERYEVNSLSELYNKGGLEALLPYIAKNVWEGNFHLHRGSKLCKLLLEGYEKLSESVMLRHFLDTDRAAKYMTAYTLFRMNKGQEPSLKELHALRNNKEAVLEVCSKNPAAFNFAGDAVCRDRETAKAYIEANGHQLLFSMPLHFRADKELAKLALERDGTTFRQLDPSILDDKELIALAFDSTLDRPHFEHLPDLIPPEVRKDTAFMVRVISKCPQMHLFRALDLAENKDIVKALLDTRNWNPFSLRNIPSRILSDPDIQNKIRTSMQSKPDKLKIAEGILLEKGIILRKPSLDEQLHQAEKKVPSGTDHSLAKSPEQGIEME